MTNSNIPSFAVGSKSFTAVAINIASKAGEWIQSKLGDFTSCKPNIRPTILSRKLIRALKR